MPSLFKQLSPINLTSAGTPQRISSSQVLAEAALITAVSTNSGSIYIGDSNVAANNAIVLTAGQSVEISSSGDYFDLRDIYIDGSSTNDDVKVSYLQKQN